MLRAGIALSVLALFVAACSDGDADDLEGPAWTQGPVIEAVGRAYLEVPPNRARFSVTFEAKNADSAAASRAAVEIARAAGEAIRLAAEDQVRITSDLDVRPYYEQERIQIDEFREQIIENVHPDHRLGFVARSTVNVVVLDVAQAGAARGAALAAEPVSANDIYFYLEPTIEHQRMVFAAAADDAHARAEIAAESTGSRLGRLLVLQENSGPCLSYPTSTTGFDDYDRYRGAMADMPVSAAAPPPPEATEGAQAFRQSVEDIAAAAGEFELAADPDPQRVQAQACAIYAVRR
ncbi:MAG: SIMPL domain-containing protein [Maricaulaceae bacterium]|jgi:uncharacterized protein YggE